MSPPRWLRMSGIAVAVLLALFLIGGPLTILFENQRPAEMPVQQRLGWNLKNSSRLVGATPGAVSVAASRARFPDPSRRAPGAAVILSGDDPAFALATAALAAPPLNAALFATEPGDEAAVAAEIRRLGAQRVYDARSGAGESSLGPDPIVAAAAAVGLLADARGAAPHRVILVDIERARDVVPLIPWLALSGDALLFTAGGEIPPATAQVLRRVAPVRTVYRGPGAPDPPDGTAAQLQTLPSFEGARGAVEFAEFYDVDGGLGWGYDRSRRNGYHHYILALDGDWKSAFGAATLAPTNRTPLLWTEADRLSGVTEAYLWKIKPEFYREPDEGPFLHTWVAGGLDRIAFGPQARSDLALETGHYRTKSAAGASALELLMIGWMILSLSLAGWVALHVARRMQALHWTMKYGWPLLVLITGPIGLWMYLALYHRQPRTHMTMHGETMAKWHRGPQGQVGAATAMGVAFDMPLMVVVSYVVTLFGMPAIIFNGPLFWIGQSMVVTMLIAYAVPLLVATVLYETPMQMMHRRVGFSAGLRHAWSPMTAAMTAGWVGMMGSMWWLHMIYPVGMSMPEEDEVRWWGLVAFAVLIGVLFEWLVNFWLVRSGRRPGSM